MSETSNIPETYADARTHLDELARGKVTNPLTGKAENRDTHLVARDIREFTMRFLNAHGEFLRSPMPLYLDNIHHKLIPAGKDSPQMAFLLRQLGFSPKHGYCPMVKQTIEDVAATRPIRDCHHLSYMSSSAIYLNASPTTMIKVTEDEITEVDLGSDGVILMASDIAPWPSLEELSPSVDSMRSVIGKTCTELRPELPLTEYLTTRWSHESILSPDQAHEMFIARVIFLFCASLYSLWPLLLHTGEQNSGKSTPIELLLTLLTDKPGEAKALPYKERDLIASLTNSSVAAYDNIDDSDLDSPARATYSNTLCLISTGGQVDLARLYSNNVLDSYSLRNHGLFTARQNPFNRSDVMRRTIHLEMDPPRDGAAKDKDRLKKALLLHRKEILGEILLRLQNIVRAHKQVGAKEYSYQSEMAEYETFTLRCAEYEGSLAITRNLWASYMRKYRESITESNPLVYAISLWLGKSDANIERVVSPTELFVGLQTIYTLMNQKCPYRAANAFGKNLMANIRPLQSLGIERVKVRTGWGYRFSPSPEEWTRCRKLYRDISGKFLIDDNFGAEFADDLRVALTPNSSRYDINSVNDL